MDHYTSGVRLGTPALTTLGFGADEMDEVADIIVATLRSTTAGSAEKPTSLAAYRLDERVSETCRARSAELLAQHLLYPGLVVT